MNNLGQFVCSTIMSNQTSEMRLLMAVVNQAVSDMCLVPHKQIPRSITVCAFEDLFLGHLDNYLLASNVQPHYYIKKLVKHMFSNKLPVNKYDYTLQRKKNFRVNYKYVVNKLKKANVRVIVE